MKRVAWLTDVHLDLLLANQRREFFRQVARARVEAILISGDISEAPRLIDQLEEMDDAWDVPVYFVLGNHDYFHGTIAGVREAVTALCQQRSELVWLTAADVVELSPQSALVGHDGWADGRLGDYERSLVMMLDYTLIGEFVGLDKARRWQLLQQLADEAARQTRDKLLAAVARYRQVYLLTHIPPFREACWYNGQISNSEWLPHFTSQAMGAMLLDVMSEHPECHLTVLCGHTHGRGQTSPRDNVLVLTGGAEYGLPEIQRVFDLN